MWGAWLIKRNEYLHNADASPSVHHRDNRNHKHGAKKETMGVVISCLDRESCHKSESYNHIRVHKMHLAMIVYAAEVYTLGLRRIWV